MRTMQPAQLIRYLQDNYNIEQLVNIGAFVKHNQVREAYPNTPAITIRGERYQKTHLVWLYHRKRLPKGKIYRIVGRSNHISNLSVCPRPLTILSNTVITVDD